jgi:protein-disulfide isomerase
VKKILVVIVIVAAVAGAGVGSYFLGLSQGKQAGFALGFDKGQGRADLADRPLVMPLLRASERSVEELLGDAGWAPEDLGDVDPEAWTRLLNSSPSPFRAHRQEGMTLAAALATDEAAGVQGQVTYARDLLAAGREEAEARKRLYMQVRQTFDVESATVLGPSEAPVQIVWWMDFQCPYCEQAWPVVQELRATYPEDVQFVVMNLPLRMHAEADEAGRAAWAAGQQGKFDEMAEALFDVRKLAKHIPEDGAAMEKLARDVGLDMDRYRADYAAAGELVDAQKGQARGAGVTGVPAFFINGTKPRMRLGVETYVSYIEQVLAGDDPALAP